MLATAGLCHGEVIYETDYTAAQGFADGNLQGQDGWQGQAIAQVDSTGTGSVSSVGGPFDRNSHGNGARGGVAGVPATEGNFQPFESIRITFNYSFSLSADGGIVMGNAGIRPDGPNSGNGFNSVPTQGFKLEYNPFDDEPLIQDDGGVKFFPDRNDSANSEAMILDGIDVGISPGTADGSAVDLDSDPLEIEWVVTRNGSGGFTVTSFKVTNLMTTSVFTYGGPTQTFDWFETDAETDPYLDAFFAQQLAPNSDNAFTGTTDGARFEFIEAPAVRPVFDFDFLASEGFVDGNLTGQVGWVGQSTPAVDVSGTGTVSTNSSGFLRNLYSNGLLGSSGGDPTTFVDSWTIGESVEIVVDYKFILGAPDLNKDLGQFGFRDEGPNAGNGFNAAPIDGFNLRYNFFNDAMEGGLIQIFPDLRDAAGGDLSDALVLSGNQVGIDPFNDLGGGVDLESDTMRFTLTLLIDEDDPFGNDGFWDGLFTVTSFTAENLTTLDTFTYAGNPQEIFWNDTGDENGFPFDDAFYAHFYVRSNATSTPTGIVDRTAVSFLAADDGGDSSVTITSVEVTGGNLVVNFTGVPGGTYKLTESPDLVTPFVDTDPLQSTTADGTTGAGTLSIPVSGDSNFVRVEEDPS